MCDMVRSPSHYVKNSITLEPIELSNRLDSSLGQAVQYVVRRNDKDSFVVNLRKARFELEWCQENLAWKQEYRFTCVGGVEFATYVDLFVRHTKDEFLRKFLLCLFESKTFKPRNLEIAIDLIDEAISKNSDDVMRGDTYVATTR